MSVSLITLETVGRTLTVCVGLKISVVSLVTIIVVVTPRHHAVGTQVGGQCRSFLKQARC